MSKENLSKHWKYVNKDFKLIDVLGEGTFGKVIHAKRRTTKQEVAIKFVKCDLTNTLACRNLIRELGILR